MADPRWADTEVQWLETARQNRCLAVVSDIINTHTLGTVRVRQSGFSEMRSSTLPREFCQVHLYEAGDVLCDKLQGWMLRNTT